MDYIVFDLEWNQCPNGRQNSNQRLPFEIIEIGAVRMNEQLQVTDSFHRLIRPQVYKWIHNSIHDVTHMDIKDLQEGVIFPAAAREFISWCGKEYRFCTWGDQDVMELQRNMKYYGILRLIPPPVVYLDVQKLFAYCYDNPEDRRSLEYATDFLKIEKQEDFHRALNDAHFTARVLSHIETRYTHLYPSLDTFQHPLDKTDEYHISFPACTKYVSREFSSKEKAMKDREVSSTRCPYCRKNARRTLRWFTPNGKVYYSVSNCPEHGDIAGSIRFRKGEGETVFAEKTLGKATEKDLDIIRSKRDQKRMNKEK